MKYWWVNQGQTFKQEYSKGFLWSPQVDSNGAFNYSYQTMTLVEPGDVIFSYAGKKISAVGIAQRKAYLGPKPDFGVVGKNWNQIGWYVDVEFQLLKNEISPKDYLDSLLVHLPEKYSPLLKDGSGNQKMYLVDISYEIADILLTATGSSISEFESQCSPFIDTNSEYEIRLEIAARGVAGNVEQEQLIMARRGQGIFRHNVRNFESACRLTKVSDARHLVASHIKPWRVSDEIEKLDGNNGLMLSPHVDHLFDGGFITFENSGELVVSRNLDQEVMEKWALLHVAHVKEFNSIQAKYLDYHRQEIFKAS